MGWSFREFPQFTGHGLGMIFTLFTSKWLQRAIFGFLISSATFSGLLWLFRPPRIRAILLSATTFWCNFLPLGSIVPNTQCERYPIADCHASAFLPAFLPTFLSTFPLSQRNSGCSIAADRSESGQSRRTFIQANVYLGERLGGTFFVSESF